MGCYVYRLFRQKLANPLCFGGKCDSFSIRFGSVLHLRILREERRKKKEISMLASVRVRRRFHKEKKR
jgi:hypothetical protein